MSTQNAINNSSTPLNKVTITQPATGATLTIIDGKTLTVSNTLTLTGTDGSSVAFGTGGTVLYANQTVTLSGDVTGSGSTAITTTVAKIAGTTVSGTTGSTNVVFSNSPTLVTPVLGVASATTINKVTITTPATGSTLTIVDGATLTASATATVSGTNTGDQTITLTSDVTGSGTGSFATTIAAGVVTLAKMANVATATVFYRKTAGTGAPEVQTLATLKTDLGLTGTNSGDVTLAGQNYLTIAGQVITANAVDLSGTNATGVLAAARFPALTGDITTASGALATTLATVNSNVGSFTNALITVNAKGLITAVGASRAFSFFTP